MSELILKKVKVEKYLNVFLEKNGETENFICKVDYDSRIWDNVDDIKYFIETKYRDFEYKKIKNEPYFQVKCWTDDEYFVDYDITKNTDTETWIKQYFPDYEIDFCNDDDCYSVVAYQVFRVSTLSEKTIDDDDDDWHFWDGEPDRLGRE